MTSGSGEFFEAGRFGVGGDFDDLRVSGTKVGRSLELLIGVGDLVDEMGVFGEFYSTVLRFTGLIGFGLISGSTDCVLLILFKMLGLDIWPSLAGFLGVTSRLTALLSVVTGEILLRLGCELFMLSVLRDILVASLLLMASRLATEFGLATEFFESLS